MFLVCLVLNEVFLIVCCNTPNQPKGHTNTATPSNSDIESLDHVSKRYFISNFWFSLTEIYSTIGEGTGHGFASPEN